MFMSPSQCINHRFLSIFPFLNLGQINFVNFIAYNANKIMHKCEHNDKISIFCLSEHCSWKEPAGCDRCIKKYHNHVANQKFISEEELIQLAQKVSLQNVPKPNSRKIQQSLYSYFTTLKNEFASSLDIICKNLINATGSPYLSQHNLLPVYKRIKNKQYKRLQQKQFRKFYETALRVNVSEIAKQQTKLYKEQIRKSQKFITGLQAVLSSYEGLFKQLNEPFQRQKSTFETLTLLLKQTIENADLSINLLQFHQREMEKNKAERAEKQQKNNASDIKKMLNEYDSMLSTNYSSRLVSANKEKPAKTPQVIKTPSNIKEDHFYDTANHKFGVKDFGTLEKLQKSDSQQMKTKRPLSLDKKLATNLSVQMPTSTERKRSDFGLMEEIKNMQNDKVERQKITFAEKHESILNDFCSESSTKKPQQSTPTPFDKPNLRENEISIRKEQLIEMMKNQSLVVKNGEKQKITDKTDVKAMNNSLVGKPKIEQILNESNARKNYPSFFGDKNPRQQTKSSQKSQLQYRKSIEPKNHLVFPLSNRVDNRNSPLKKLPVHEIPDIAQDIEKSSQGSLEVLKKIIYKKNMNAHPKLPIQQVEDRPKELAQSRLIIVPTGQKFQMEKPEECDSPLLKKKVSNTAKKDSIAQKFPKKQEKPDIKESEEKSLNLLIKAIHLKPEQAIVTLQAALKQGPNNLSAAQYLSYLYIQNFKPKEALYVCNMILDRFEIITKENEQLLINLESNKAAALNMLGRYSQAIVLIQRCLKFKEKDTLLKNLADAYYFSSNYQKAIFYYQKTVKTAPLYDQAYYNMAVCLYLQNNFHNAHQSVVKAIEIAPKNPEYLELKTNVELKISQGSNL